jgi:hypothetical protein
MRYRITYMVQIQAKFEIMMSDTIKAMTLLPKALEE